MPAKTVNSPLPPSLLQGEITPDGIRAGKLPSHLRYAQQIADQGVTRRIQEYGAEKARFEHALSHWETKDAAQLGAVLEATRFIDWAHMATELIEVFRSRGELSVLERGLQHLYNRAGQEKDPEFKNIQEVNHFLKSTPLPCSLKRLKEVHSIAMKGRVEGLSADSLGMMRNCAVYGAEKKIAPLIIARIQKNPYLTFVVTKTRPPSNESLKARDALFDGEFWYPEPATVKKEALDRIRSLQPDLVASIEEFQQLPRTSQIRERNQSSNTYKSLTQDLVTALCEERYATFQRESEKFLSLTTVSDVMGYIKCVALHYRDLISIHPLEDGNGRSIRYESLYAPLDCLGISRPRLLDVDSDLLHSPSGWVDEVHKGIQSTHSLYKDITERVLSGLRVENCPELVFPNLIRDVGIELRHYGGKKVERNVTLYQVDGPQFGAFVDVHLTANKKLARAFSPEKAVATISDLRTAYKEFIKRTVIIAKVPGEQPEPLGLHLVDFDQRAAFGIPHAQDPEKWRNKLDRWHTSTPIWRGMCDLENEISTIEVLDIFRSLTWISLSNGTAHLYDSSLERKRSAVLKNFDEYNTALVNNSLYQTVVDHIDDGSPGYDGSFGVSTSRKWGFAAGFGWGRGAISYDNNEVKAAQHTVKSRVVIGAFRAKKDIDVRRFRMLDSRFSYKFPRQQEIIAIGGIDPDSIFTVQLLDKNRRIARSFVRNLERPSEILEMRGKVMDPSSIGAEKNIIERHRIF